MVVARPVEPSSVSFHSITSAAPIVPTKILNDYEELDRQLIHNGYPQIYNFAQNADCDGHAYSNGIESNSLNINGFAPIPENENCIIVTPADADSIPETERFRVELNKNEFGLGITIAGYVCEREDLCGIFVKSISQGSAADKCGAININDRIVEVDRKPLLDCTNHEAVEKLKQTGDVVELTLERYLRGPKYEHLQEALASQEDKVSFKLAMIALHVLLSVCRFRLISVRPRRRSQL